MFQKLDNDLVKKAWLLYGELAPPCIVVRSQVPGAQAASKRTFSWLLHYGRIYWVDMTVEIRDGNGIFAISTLLTSNWLFQIHLKTLCEY